MRLVGVALLASISLHAAAAASPAFVQHVSTANSRLSDGQTYHVFLPNASLGGNALIVSFQYSSYQYNTEPFVSDNAGNSYSLLILLIDTNVNQALAVYGAFNINAGATEIIIVTPSLAQSWSAAATEFYNIATVSAVDGQAYASAYGTTGMTTTTDGDLIYQIFVQDDSTGWYGASLGADSGFTLLSADVGDGMAVQYEIQARQGPINPAITATPAGGYLSAAVALKAAAAGTAPGPGIRIQRIQFYTVESGATALNVEFPSSGSLLVAAWDGYNGSPDTHCTVTGIIDSNGDNWTSRAIASQNTNATPGTPFSDEQILDASTSPGSGSSLTLYITLDNPSGGSTLTLYDVVNAQAGSSFDQAATAIGSQDTGDGPVSMASITPSSPNGLVISAENQDIGTTRYLIGGDSTYYFDTPYFDEENGGFNSLAEDKGNAHVYNLGTDTITFTWAGTDTSTDGIGGWANVAAAYFSGSSPK
jgi:hypothetical protein